MLLHVGHALIRQDPTLGHVIEESIRSDLEVVLHWRLHTLSFATKPRRQVCIGRHISPTHTHMRHYHEDASQEPPGPTSVQPRAVWQALTDPALCKFGAGT